MSGAIALTLLLIAVLICVSSLDDLVTDFLGYLIRGRRTRRSRPPVHPKTDFGRKSIGIFIANWHEADVLDATVEGNLEALTFQPLTIFLGVYPNDDETLAVALALERRHPDAVRVIVNTMAGPTSKGQLLNLMFAKAFDGGALTPELAVIHDSEDVVDPRSLDLYSELSDDFDFIQIPVFSLDSRHRSLVGAHYMEEFAERHCGEMPTRSALGAIVPSAGVGTCVTRRVVEYFNATRGALLENSSVVEDYILGAEVHRAGFRSVFAIVDERQNGRPNIVATLEYFPKHFFAATKQKTRWVYGICFEGTRKLGWSRGARENFFFYRDRKGAITNLLPPVALTLGIMALALEVSIRFDNAVLDGIVFSVLAVNIGALGVRLMVKLAAVKHVYGVFDPFGVVIRWPVSICVNSLATLRAWKIFLVESRFATRPITWAKTQHEVPVFAAPPLAGANAAAFQDLADLPAVPAVFGRPRVWRIQ